MRPFLLSPTLCLPSPTLTSPFFLARSDGNVRMYEYDNDELFYLCVPSLCVDLARRRSRTPPRARRSDYTSPHPQRGMCLAPARSVNVAETEIARVYKAFGTTIEPISFRVPRKVRRRALLLLVVVEALETLGH